MNENMPEIFSYNYNNPYCSDCRGKPSVWTRPCRDCPVCDDCHNKPYPPFPPCPCPCPPKPYPPKPCPPPPCPPHNTCDSDGLIWLLIGYWMGNNCRR